MLTARRLKSVGKMGRYNVGYHGPTADHDVYGIATLTHDPIAFDNLKKSRKDKVDKIKTIK